MSVPRVYVAISAITRELAENGIAKARINQRGQYSYRSIDDVTARLAPLLAKHRLCILPRVIERSSLERAGAGDTLLVSVALRVAFEFVSARDGSLHTVEAFGEALDDGDKATAKAMSAAYKQAVLQAFCVPIECTEDADASSHRLKSGEQLDPVQGWDQWAFDIQDMIRLCETTEALDRVQETYRALLHAASKRRPDIYSAIGAIMRVRRGELDPPVLPRPAVPFDEAVRGRGRKANGSAQAQVGDDQPQAGEAAHA
jgi:hypothetical protein